MIYLETQESISAWANSTFGPTGTNLRVAIRANEEMAELLQKLAIDDSHPQMAEEVSDIFIVLYRLAQRQGFDIHEEIDKKMATNRRRKWKLDGSGCGQHV